MNGRCDSLLTGLTLGFTLGIIFLGRTVSAAGADLYYEYEKYGTKTEPKPDTFQIFLGHDPHLFATDEKGIGNGSLVFDFCITWHIHDGYKAIVEPIFGSRTLQHDMGWVEQPHLVDKDGNPAKRTSVIPFYGKTNLCRGIVYFVDPAHHEIWQSPNNEFYKNVSDEVNVQDWQPVEEEEARRLILDKNLRGMLISEGITPLSPLTMKEKRATINVVDIHGDNEVQDQKKL